MADELIEMFPQEYLDLARECQYHTIQGVSPTKSIEENLVHIAAYCEVILDGEYTREDVKRICTLLAQKLHNSRIITVN